MKLNKNTKDATLAPEKAGKVAIVGNVGRYWTPKEDYARSSERNDKIYYLDKFDSPLAYYDDLTGVSVISSRFLRGLEKLVNNPDVKWAKIIDQKTVKDSDDNLEAQIEILLAAYKEKYGKDYVPKQNSGTETNEITDSTVVTEENLSEIQKKLEQDLQGVVLLTVNFIDKKEKKEVLVDNVFLAINGDTLTFNYDTEDTTSAYLDNIADTLYEDFSMDLSEKAVTYGDVVNNLTSHTAEIITTSGREE